MSKPDGDPTEAPTSGSSVTRRRDVMEALKDVVDPELGDQRRRPRPGLRRQPRPADEGAQPVATIDMTLTSAACPLTDVIEDQANSRSPAWSPTW